MMLKRWLSNTYDIDLNFIDELESDGYFIPSRKLMILNPKLSEEDMIKVAMHELGHYLNDDDVVGKYNDYVARSQMEYKANFYMIEHTLDTWCNANDIDLKDVNCTTFLSANNLSLNYIPIVETIIKNKIWGIIGLQM